MIQERTKQHHTIGQDNNYYRYIFKKTEKITSAVFYILQSQRQTHQDSLLTKDTEATALRTLNRAIESLSQDVRSAEATLRELHYAHIELESKLRVLCASQYLTEPQLHIFVSEIDSLGRTLEQYIRTHQFDNPLEWQDDVNDTQGNGSRSASRERAFARDGGGGGRAISAPGSARNNTRSGDASGMAGQNTNERRSRIVEVLQARGEVSIKDISEVVRDCSEKTIQRELNALIKDNTIQRQGQRRWSKYSMV